MPELQSLPIEILELISIYVDGDSALALCRASHVLRSACNTVSVWRSILDRQCSLTDRSGIQREVGPCGLPRLSIQMRPNAHDVTVVMHHAVAATRGLAILEDLGMEKTRMDEADPTLTIARYVEYVGTTKLFGCE